MNRERARSAVVRRVLPFMRHLFGGRPVPLTFWLYYRACAHFLFGCNDPIVPPSWSIESREKDVGVPCLRGLITDDMLGAWALDAATIGLLWTILDREKPSTILECGSGVSTIVLAQYASVATAQGKPVCVVSMEQSVEIRGKLVARLAAHGLDRFVTVICPPNPGGYSNNADLSECIRTGMGTSRADLVLIDGPMGTGRKDRLDTLPSFIPFCRHDARWYLDDSFRDGELSALRAWRKTPSIAIEGIYAVGKGFAVGRVADPGSGA